MKQPLLTLFATQITVLAALLAGCSSAPSQPTKGATGPANSGEVTSWIEASPQMAQQIEVRSNEVEVVATMEDFVRLSDWFQNVGEPAYPKLLQMASSSSRRSKEFGLSVIAAIADPRMLGQFKDQVSVPSGDNVNHRYEYARALMRMGDISGAPYLIEGLSDAEPRKRALAQRALVESTRNRIPFDSSGTEEERAASIQAWQDWYDAQTSDAMLDG